MPVQEIVLPAFIRPDTEVVSMTFERIKALIQSDWKRSWDPENPYQREFPDLTVTHISTSDAQDVKEEEWYRVTVVRLTGVTGYRGAQPDLPSTGYRIYATYFEPNGGNVECLTPEDNFN
jgi:hypothetical protein